MAGIRSNQIFDGQITTAKLADASITAAKIAAELDASIKYANTVTISDPKDLTNKAYVDAQILANAEGLDVKKACRLATEFNLQAAPSTSPSSGVGFYLESIDPGPSYPELSLDGNSPVAGDRILVKNQGGAIFSIGAFAAKVGSNYRFTDGGEFAKYFEFEDYQGNKFYVWFDDGTGLDPSGATTAGNRPDAAATGIAVDISAITTGSDIAQQAESDINTASISGLTLVRFSDTIYFVWETQTAGNDATTLTDGNLAGALGFTITAVMPGEPDASVGRRNGIYIYEDTNSGTQKWRLVRSVDFDEDAEVTANAFCFVSEGTSQADTGWTLVTNDPITVDTTGQTWTQFSGAGAIIAGEALLKTGNTLDVLYDNSTIGLSGTDLTLLDNAVSTAKIQNLAVSTGKIADAAVNTNKLANLAATAKKLSGDTAIGAGEFRNGLFIKDGVLESWYTAGDTKPQFAAHVSVDLSSIVGAAPVPGDTFTSSVNSATGIFLGYDDPTSPNTMYYLPTNANVLVGSDTLDFAAAGSIDTTAVPLVNDRSNTPDGSTVLFDLSIRTYNEDVITAGQTAPEYARPTEGTVEVYRNGVRMREVAEVTKLNGPDDFYVYYGVDTSLTGNQGRIRLGAAPAYGEEIEARYIAHDLL